MRKILFSFAALLCFALPVHALDTSVKVYDDANLLTDYEEQQLSIQAQNFVDKYDMDLVLVTTSYNDGKGTKAYAQDFYDYNDFGVGNTNDGILFLIDRTYGYNDTYMVTTGHAILVYDDARINYILDDIYAVRNNGYYTMFSTFISSSSTYADLGVAPSNENMYIDENGEYREKRVFPLFMFIVISIIVPTIIVIILLLKNKMVRKATKATAYLDESTISYTQREDRFITTHTTRTYVPRSSSGSGGGSHGGSSISRGSSGTSHGGGGRRM